jgi:glucokinase
MILAGDVGGTKTNLALFDVSGGRLRQGAAANLPSSGLSGLGDAIERFLTPGGPSIQGAAFGVAGPVSGNRVKPTNLPWELDSTEIASRFGIGCVRILNDLEAMAWGIEALEPDDLVTLQEGCPNPDGNGAVIAAGTGLGEALLIRHEGRLFPSATEGGHTDFGPSDEETDRLMLWMRRKYGHVSAERVVSGMGLEEIYYFAHDVTAEGARAHFPEGTDIPGAVAVEAASGSCDTCRRAFDLFIRCYGEEAGNLALKSAATSGFYVGGGIAAKNIEAMKDGRFMRAFLDKGRFAGYLRRVPVKVVMNESAPLLGAALVAARMAGIMD